MLGSEKSTLPRTRPGGNRVGRPAEMENIIAPSNGPVLRSSSKNTVIRPVHHKDLHPGKPSTLESDAHADDLKGEYNAWRLWFPPRLRAERKAALGRLV